MTTPPPEDDLPWELSGADPPPRDGPEPVRGGPPRVPDDLRCPLCGSRAFDRHRIRVQRARWSFTFFPMTLLACQGCGWCVSFYGASG